MFIVAKAMSYSFTYTVHIMKLTALVGTMCSTTVVIAVLTLLQTASHKNNVKNNVSNAG